MLSCWVPVLKYKFDHYSGMVRPVDEEMSGSESQLLRGQRAPHRATEGSTSVHQQSGRGSREWGTEMGKNLYGGCSGRNRHSGVGSFRTGWFE